MEFNLHSKSMGEGAVISLNLQRGKLRLRDIKQLAGDPRAAKWQSRQHRTQIHA